MPWHIPEHPWSLRGGSTKSLLRVLCLGMEFVITDKKKTFYDPKDSEARSDREMMSLRTFLSLKLNSHLNDIWFLSSCGVPFPCVDGAGWVPVSLIMPHIREQEVVTWILGDQGPRLHFPGQRRE